MRRRRSAATRASVSSSRRRAQTSCCRNSRFCRDWIGYAMSSPAITKRRPRFSPLVLGLVLALLLLIVPPTIYLVQSSLRETNFDGSFGAFTFDHYLGLIDTNRFILALLNSAAYAAGSA